MWHEFLEIIHLIFRITKAMDVKFETNYRHSLIYAVNVGTHKKPVESENCVNQGYLVVLSDGKRTVPSWEVPGRSRDGTGQDRT